MFECRREKDGLIECRVLKEGVLVRSVVINGGECIPPKADLCGADFPRSLIDDRAALIGDRALT
jgi:hypothetical protein